MPSSNPDSPQLDPAAFEAEYGISAQSFVERSAVSTALAPTLAAQKAALAAAKTKLVPGGWEHLTDQAAMQAGADALNLYQSISQDVSGMEARQAYAKQFAAGTLSWGAFRSYLGRECQMLIDNGVIDGDAVQAAVKAALG